MKYKYLAGFLLSTSLVVILNSCVKNQKKEMKIDSQKSSLLVTNFKEQFRPQFHFTPEEKWMNDPNGLVYHDGIYHLFYQYHPGDIVWGPMHWGHATSKDLVSWEHKPIALFPDEHGMIFSGSAVVDINNTTGLGTKDNPPLVAIFTYHLMEGEQSGRKDFQTQGIAYSLDNGDTWVKYEGNPVIGNEGIKDFRDPKVFWHDDTNQWMLVLVAGDHAKFYSSSDLKSWAHLSDFGQDKGAHGGVWECPDLFKLKVEGNDKEKWVLLISINPGAPNGGSGTQYFVGDFDGKVFTVDHTDQKWIDYGADNYAGVTYNNTPNHERIFVGWMSNWNYAEKTPTKVWRSAMTLPRTLSLHFEKGRYYIKNYPVEAFDKQLETVVFEEELPITIDYVINNIDFNQTDISFSIDAKKLNAFGFNFENSKNEEISFLINPNNGKILFNRSKSGLTNFDERFADKSHELSYTKIKNKVDFRIILDHSSVEIFIDGGRYVFTEQIFPTEKYNTLRLFSKNKITVDNFNIKSVKSVWKTN